MARCKIRLVLARGGATRDHCGKIANAEILMAPRCMLAAGHEGLHCHSGRGLPSLEQHHTDITRVIQSDAIFSITWRSFM